MHLLSGIASVNVTASVNDWDPGTDTSDVVAINSSGAWNITGMAAKYRGRVLTLVVTAGSVILKASDASSAAANRFSAGQDFELKQYDVVQIWYNIVTATWWVLSHREAAAITFAWDGGGSAITAGAGTTVYVPMSYRGVIVAATLLADTSGSAVVDVWKDTYANYPPTVADTITASAKPTLSAAIKSQDTTLTGWTRTFTESDVMAAKIDSASTVTKLSLTLRVVKL